MTNKIYHFLLVLFYFLLFISCSNKASIQQTIDNGNLIVHALDEYYSRNQHYPKKLDELVPNYLIMLPEAKAFNLFFGKSIYVYRSISHTLFAYEIQYYDYSEHAYYKYNSQDKVFIMITDQLIPNDAKIIDKINRENIIVITKALDQYFLENNQYPRNIEDLMPDYISTMPFNQNGEYKINNTNHNGLFNYIMTRTDSINDFNNYELFFKYNLFYGYLYNSINRAWKYFTTLI